MASRRHPRLATERRSRTWGTEQELARRKSDLQSLMKEWEELSGVQESTEKVLRGITSDRSSDNPGGTRDELDGVKVRMCPAAQFIPFLLQLQSDSSKAVRPDQINLIG